MRQSDQESPGNAGVVFGDRGDNYLAGECGYLVGEVGGGLGGLGDVAEEIEEEGGDVIGAERVGPEGVSEGIGNGAKELEGD